MDAPPTVGHPDGPPPLFEWFEPETATSPLVFACPHAGRYYPPEFLASADADRASLQQLEDRLVDHLLPDRNRLGVPLLKANVARAWLDLNRSETDLDPAMFSDRVPVARASTRAASGLGLLPRYIPGGRPIYRTRLRYQDAQDRIASCHRPYHQGLATRLERVCAQRGQALLIDWHSMPSSAVRHISRDGGPDIVLGDRFGQSCASRLTLLLQQLLMEAGFSCLRNTPYSGAHTATHHSNLGRNINVVQFEINRRIYLNEASHALSADAEGVKARLEAAFLQAAELI